MTSTVDLTKYRRPGYTPKAAKPEAPSAPDARKPYTAYQSSENERRYLQIRSKFPDPAECPLNAMITSITGEWRMGLAITLDYGKQMVVQIRGERLTPLFEALMNWKVEWIAEFDPEEHQKPTDSGAPFIESITIHTTKPEAPPPPEQRH